MHLQLKENPKEKYNITLMDIKISNNQIQDEGEATLNHFIQRNKELPNNIVEKIYQIFIQKQQGQIANPILLEEIESRLIATSPNSCVEILKKLLQKDGIPEILSENPKILVDHVRQFPGGLGLSGLKILLASAQLKEPENFFTIDNFSPKEISLLMGVAKDMTGPPSKLAGLPDEVYTKIYSELKESKPSQSAQAPQATQTQQPSLNPTQNPR